MEGGRENSCDALVACALLEFPQTTREHILQMQKGIYMKKLFILTWLLLSIGEFFLAKEAIAQEAPKVFCGTLSPTWLVP
jgi:hypothetical protein